MRNKIIFDLFLALSMVVKYTKYFITIFKTGRTMLKEAGTGTSTETIPPRRRYAISGLRPPSDWDCHRYCCSVFLFFYIFYIQVFLCYISCLCLCSFASSISVRWKTGGASAWRLAVFSGYFGSAIASCMVMIVAMQIIVSCFGKTRLSTFSFEAMCNWYWTPSNWRPIFQEASVVAR